MLSAPCAGPLTGTFHVGVGTRDEPLHLLGVTHLMEHLVFRRMAPLTMLHNGEGGSDSVTFWACGTPEEVVTFLNALPGAFAGLADATDAELASELSVIGVEQGRSPYFRGGMALYRHGASGLGRAHLGSPTLETITLEEVRPGLATGSPATTWC